MLEDADEPGAHLIALRHLAQAQGIAPVAKAIGWRLTVEAASQPVLVDYGRLSFCLMILRILVGPRL